MGRKKVVTADAPKDADGAPNGNGSSLKDLLKELWEAAVNLRGSIEPADYKRYVLPIIFLRFPSLRYERRRAELEALIADPNSTHHTTNKKHAAAILNSPDEYQAGGAFIVPEEVRWAKIVEAARKGDIRLQSASHSPAASSSARSASRSRQSASGAQAMRVGSVGGKRVSGPAPGGARDGIHESGSGEVVPGGRESQPELRPLRDDARFGLSPGRVARSSVG